VKISSLVRLIAAMALAIAGPAVITVSPAHAYPTEGFIAFDGNAPYLGKTEGTITWYNRSVGVQGYVFDSIDRDDQSTTAIFRFYIGDEVFWHSESRTVNAGERSFNFTVEGPPGGITTVAIWVCHTIDPNCREQWRRDRP
jgi:hypothetical protein